MQDLGKILILSTLFLFAAPFAAYSQTSFTDGLQLGAHYSTLGLGINAGYDISDAFSIRGLINQSSEDFNRTLSSINFKGKGELQSFGLVLDWYPIEGGLRVSGAVFNNNNKISIKAKSNEFELGSGIYSGSFDPVLDFDAMAPYLGVGWTSGRGDSGFSFDFDLGLFFQGAPSISASGNIGRGNQDCQFKLSKEGNAAGCDIFKRDLEAEHKELRGAVDDFKMLSVFSIGISYRF